MRLKTGAALADYLFVMRPTLFFPVWTVFLAGYLNAALGANQWGTVDTLVTAKILWSRHLISIGFLLTLLCGGIFILNQIQDITTDKENNKLFIIANNYLSRRTAYIEAISLVFIALIGSAFTSTRQTVLFVLLFLLSGWAYSFPPLLWKDKPFAGLMTNALTGYLIFTSGWCLVKPFSAEAGYSALAYILAIAAIYLYTTVPDRQGDYKAGKMTFSVKYGLPQTTRLALILGFCAIGCTIWVGDWRMFLATAFSIPFFIKVHFSQKMSDLSLATKLPILFLALTICWKIPYYMGLILLVFYGSKWYYKVRFNLNYPVFSERNE